MKRKLTTVDGLLIEIFVQTTTLTRPARDNSEIDLVG